MLYDGTYRIIGASGVGILLSPVTGPHKGRFEAQNDLFFSQKLARNVGAKDSEI